MSKVRKPVSFVKLHSSYLKIVRQFRYSWVTCGITVKYIYGCYRKYSLNVLATEGKTRCVFLTSVCCQNFVFHSERKLQTDGFGEQRTEMNIHYYQSAK